MSRGTTTQQQGDQAVGRPLSPSSALSASSRNRIGNGRPGSEAGSSKWSGRWGRLITAFPGDGALGQGLLETACRDGEAEMGEIKKTPLQHWIPHLPAKQPALRSRVTPRRRNKAARDPEDLDDSARLGKVDDAGGQSCSSCELGANTALHPKQCREVGHGWRSGLVLKNTPRQQGQVTACGVSDVGHAVVNTPCRQAQVRSPGTSDANTGGVCTRATHCRVPSSHA